MTLAELARRTGVWVETAQLLLQRGMLPNPHRLAGDEFGEEDLRVARFIGRMQAEHQLPLDTIRSVLVADHAFDLALAEQALISLVQPDPTRAGPGPTTRAALMQRTGADAGMVAALEGADLLPGQGPYGGHHAWVAESASDLVSNGMGRDEVLRLGQLGLEIAQTEVDALLGEVGRGATPREALAGTRDRREAVGRLISVARHGGSGELMARLAKASDSSKQLTLERVHVPSRLFMTRHRLEEVLRAQRTDADALLDAEAALDLRPVFMHGRLLLGLGRFAEAVRFLSAAAMHPSLARDANCWGYLGLCHGVVGDDEAAAASVEHAVSLAPDRPLPHALRAVVMAILAGRAGDLLVATARIHDALAAIKASCAVDTEDRLEALEARMSRGRLCTVLPSAFRVRDLGLADLRYVVAQTDALDDAALGFAVAGSRDLMRLNALFYLGVALDDAGEHDEADRLLAEVVALDPVSRFGTLAYQRVHRP